MGFLNNLVSEFTNSGNQGQHQGQYQQPHQGGPPQGQYQGGPPQGQYQSGPPQGAPPVSPPWYTEWDGRDNRWVFVNQQSGERTFTYPGPGYAQQQGSYGQPQGGYGYNQGGYSNQGAYNQNSYDPTNRGHEEKKSGGNGWKYAAAGVAGVAGGALLMHEGENIKEGAERRFDEFGNAVENFPENAAGWTGEQVGRVENFGDRVGDRVDEVGDDIENFPENAANWTGQQVGRVENFGDRIEDGWDNTVDDVADFGGRMDDAYDEGRDERRYDDDD